MRKYNVLVTGVGAIIGYGIINSLRKSKYDCNIIGIDIYDDAVGKHFCDTFIQAVPANDNNYITFIRDIFVKYDIDIMMFGTEQEITKIAKCRKELEDIYDKIVINSNHLISISNDKWETYLELSRMTDCMIPSYIEGEYEELALKLGKEFLMKPRRSYASKGIMKICEKEDFLYAKYKAKDQFMVQPIIGDDEHEYTVGIFGFGDGEASNCIILQRKLSGEGATSKAIVIKDDELENTVKVLCNVVHPIGPTNFQFRKHHDKFYLLEINPRISSSTSIRMAFGYNEAEMCIDFFVHKVRPSDRKIEFGSCVRYISDWIEK